MDETRIGVTAPLITFATFVGYLGGGAMGAVALTIGIFLPAFAFTLVAHDRLERLVSDVCIRTFSDALTAAVVGLIAATAATLMFMGIGSLIGATVFGAALATLLYWKARTAVPVVVAGATVAGLVLVAIGD
jgi:chromate transporter